MSWTFSCFFFFYTFHDVIANCIVLFSNRKDESFVSIPLLALDSWKIRLVNCERKNVTLRGDDVSLYFSTRLQLIITIKFGGI